MTYRILYIILFLLINISATSAKDLPPVYLNGLLLNIDIDKQVQTSYVNNGSSNTDVKKNNKNKNKTKINTYHYESLTPVTSIKNTYYFEIKIGDLEYQTSFTPIWGNETDTNWIIGKPIQVRLNDEKNRLYLLRPNGEELKTKILKITNCSN
ncbi:MAG: hypothetical protein VKK32_08525 [Candidatus Melainabacteria bacterium]|nr:hypothetical protein [Candidatus Melainabacteria bacterium]